MSSDNTRDRLLRAAASEIALHGFKGASLRGMAARVDIRAASIFHYFPGGKEELVRAMLAHIMETIVTRMLPTIDAGSKLPPAELIVRCAGLLWDFMDEHPEYAATLMRGALQPEERLSDVVNDNAQRVVAQALAYFHAAQKAGQVAPMDVRRFLLRLASYVMTFHAAPSMRRHILDPSHSSAAERDAFLARLRRELEGDAEA